MLMWILHTYVSTWSTEEISVKDSNDDNVDPLDVIENNNNHFAEIVLDLRDLIMNIDYDWDELDMILSDEDLDEDED